MRLHIRHETRYHLDHPARRSVQYLRLTPRLDRCQQVLRWTITGPETVAPWTDGFGNRVHVASEGEAHSELVFTVDGEIETMDTCGVLPLDDGLPPMMFLRDTPRTHADAAILALAAEAAGVEAAAGIEATAEATAQPPLAPVGDEVPTLHRLMGLVADRVAYRAGHTDVGSTAAEVLKHGYGVCQDHAHLFIACSRAMGIPARYVSGYLWSEHTEMASHAWAESWVKGLGWVSFDPANRQSATDAYVRLAVGFDYADACPVTGIRAGGGGESMDVSVTIAPLPGWQSGQQ
ncbi:transglutaminase family protein [Novispirillum itersonii]|uniref:Transglutaminase-like putative cysteine protease n=1 Tax=Novispirillum itersonii TaxID=189 RepID=A0A7W9ZCV2_NOVIT|nr:transglutaminase family protein [Novispirillum itersonii]MBB6208888.1 transglutaminase-like putative cysteine protease [Novispirillum itersonii]